MTSLLDPTVLLQGWGPWALLGIAVVVFIESGCLFPFLPGDSLIFTAGLLHVALGLSLPLLIVVTVLAAFTGNQVGYLLGDKFGRRLFHDDARILTPERLDQAEAFFARYGGASIVLARFVPVVRTYVPVTVGTVKFPYRRFVGWNALGGLAWAGLMAIAGSLLGHIPFITQHVDLIAIGIVMVSLVPIVISLGKSRQQARS